MSLPDKATLADTYGGPYTNERPVEDPTTELDGDAASELMNDVAACTRTVTRAWVAFTGATYTSGSQALTVTDHDANWGSATGVKPTVVQTATGIILITWPATIVDEIGVTRTLNIRCPGKPVTIDVTLSSGQVSAKTANTLSLRLFNAAGAANALNGITVIASWA
jgi:hypothetical protein